MSGQHFYRRGLPFVVTDLFKLFILGRPGSGKSTAVRYISNVLQDRKWDIRNINDYYSLLEMAWSGSPKVRLMANGGFDVRVDSAYNKALRIVKREVERIDKIYSEEQSLSNRLVTIEFSRDEYQTALQQFGDEFLKDAYLLFIHADIDTCRNRIYNRIKYPKKSDDHPSVPEEIYETRFANDNIEYMELLQQNGLFRKVEIIPNMEPLYKFHKKLDTSIESILEVEKEVVLAGHSGATAIAM
jgi:energy-coupling factor transporter ATP-binding protein EcfA2